MATNALNRFVALAKALSNVEPTVTFSRYDRSEIHGIATQHMEKEVTIPVVALQEHLEKLERVALFHADGTPSLEEVLYRMLDL